MAIVLIIQEQEITHKIPVTKKPYILGRSSKCNMKLHDPMVSGKHCAFQLSSDGKATVKDLDSSNGTYVNGFKVSETHLMMDDEVTIGAIKCWLDASQMNPKEKKIHVRETAKTTMKFIDLSEDEEKVAKKVRTSRERTKEDKNEKDEDFDPKTSIIKVDLEEIGDNSQDEDFTRTQIAKKEDKQQLQDLTKTNAEASPEPEASGNDRLAKKVKDMEKKSKSKISDPGAAVAGENEFESEETGNTKFLKVNKAKPKKVKTITKKKKEESEEEGGNLLGKIKGIFNKK